MEFINKSAPDHREAVRDIVHQLLEDSWDEEEARYIGADYNGLMRVPYRDPFKAVLLEEQQDRCGYCLKNIANDSGTTIEHIIPQSVDQVGFERYNHPFFERVVHKDDFNLYVHAIPPPAGYPHDIAYENLIASCDSRTHCNHKRGNRFIQPLLYDPAIGHLVEYDRRGGAYSEMYLDELATLGISTDRNLISYRRIWAEIAAVHPNMDENNIGDETIIETLLDISETLDDAELTRTLENLYPLNGGSTKIQDLLRYRWFFRYYVEE